MGMEFKDRISAFPNRYLMLDAANNPSTVYLERYDSPSEPGTPLNAETFNKFRDEMKPLYIEVDDVAGVGDDAPIEERYTVKLTHEELREAYFDDRLLVVHYVPNDAYIPMVYKKITVGISHIECGFVGFSTSGRRYMVSLWSSGATAPKVTAFSLSDVGGSGESGTGGSGLSIYYTPEAPVMSSGGSALFYPIAISVPEGRTLQVGDMIYSSATNTIYAVDLVSTGTGVANYCSVVGSLRGESGSSIYPANVGDNPSWIEPTSITLPEGREVQVGDMLLDTPTGRLYRVKNLLSQDATSNFIQIELLSELTLGGGSGVSIYETTFIATSNKETQISENYITLPKGSVLEKGDMLFNPITSKWFRITNLIPPSESSTYITVSPMSAMGGTFYVTFTPQEDGTTLVASKTFAEVDEAYNAGNVVVASVPSTNGLVMNTVLSQTGTSYTSTYVGDDGFAKTIIYTNAACTMVNGVLPGGGAFYFTISENDDGTYTPSKTYEEVKAAYEGGSAIIVGIDIGSWWEYVTLGEMGASGTHAFVGHCIDKEGYSRGVILMSNHCAVGKGSQPIGGSVTDEHINELIDTKLGVIANGTY